MMGVLRLLCGVVIISLASSGDAFGYIDPGAGSFIFQAIIALAAGLLFTVKLYWTKLKGLLSRLFSRRRPTGRE